MQDIGVLSAPPITSPEFWKRPERVAASSDPDTATAQTIRIMCDHVKRAGSDPVLNATAMHAADQFSGLASWGGRLDVPDARALAESAFWWCKHFVRFVHHEFIIRQKLGEAGHLQGLISPDVLVQMESPEGDCAIFTECVCAFLRVFGVPYEMVTVAVNPQEPAIYSHVYLYAVMPDGSRLPIDASHGPYPGWQVPSSDVFRRQVWDANGNPVADQGSRFDGLHNYGFRGLGDGESTDATIAYPFQDYPTPTDNYTPTGGFVQGGLTPASGGGIDWGSLLGNQLSAWTKIAGNVIAPQTTLVRGPNGQLMYSAPAGSSSGIPSLTTGLGGSSLLLFGGLAVGALLLFSAMGKK